MNKFVIKDYIDDLDKEINQKIEELESQKRTFQVLSETGSEKLKSMDKDDYAFERDSMLCEYFNSKFIEMFERVQDMKQILKITRGFSNKILMEVDKE